MLMRPPVKMSLMPLLYGYMIESALTETRVEGWVRISHRYHFPLLWFQLAFLSSSLNRYKLDCLFVLALATIHLQRLLVNSNLKHSVLTVNLYLSDCVF